MTDRPIRLTLHALTKLSVLRDHGFALERSLVEQTVRLPERVLAGHGGRWVAQGPLDDERVLRVVYEETIDEIVVVTFYPGKRSRYE
ncbi:MAG: DUF4258 domain-containing protein [SAR202 cluster bacterium]|jgi:hypothetical protein|nr:DUF4258 domain-containing protein [Chloroflexota bacterium]MDP6422943.1 DUF4258 domain-containing protein [SAR202 cluster bacterium]HAL46660.1 DUF4258 domain-containing protein [Dehalococcoidia bacterium]MDP6662655.1 DUF4258 domain-containing protein [SAR202 cluster bacterium]MDP6801421.1 DUF4258 domain-containing protein [SAR202 cluster bacterium]|tara:strand:+ start:998 stop:1258 length:261 start_codon:yes stop_codon:yes gene_type:complete